MDNAVMHGNAWNPPGLNVGRKSMELCSQCSIGITPDNVLFKSCEYAYWKMV